MNEINNKVEGQESKNILKTPKDPRNVQEENQALGDALKSEEFTFDDPGEMEGENPEGSSQSKKNVENNPLLEEGENLKNQDSLNEDKSGSTRFEKLSNEDVNELLKSPEGIDLLNSYNQEFQEKESAEKLGYTPEEYRQHLDRIKDANEDDGAIGKEAQNIPESVESSVTYYSLTNERVSETNDVGSTKVQNLNDQEYIYLDKNIDYSELNEFTESKKCETLEKICIDYNLVNDVDFHDFDSKVALSITNALIDAKKDFPELQVNYVGSIDSQVRGIHDIVAQNYEKELKKINGDTFSDEEYKKTANLYADNYIKQVGLDKSSGAFAWSLKIPTQYDPTGGGLSKYNGVAINNIFAADNHLFTECKIKEVATKHKPVGCDSPRATADHELGHEIDKLLNAKDDVYINDLYNKMLKDGNAQDKLSTYSMTNVKEFIAEAYSEYRNNPSPREYSIAVYNRLIELRNQKGGLSI